LYPALDPDQPQYYWYQKSSKWSESTKSLVFHHHYRSLPLDLADIWYDLVVGDCLPAKLKLSHRDKNEKGLRRYMMTHFMDLTKECKHAYYKIQLLCMYLLGRICLEVGEEDSHNEEKEVLLGICYK
jgi:hypothetical protein